MAPRSRRALLAALPALGGCLGVRPPAAENRRLPVALGDVSADLGFVGDVMLGRGTDDYWADADDPTAVWGPLGDRLAGLDGLFLNLECCLSTRCASTRSR